MMRRLMRMGIMLLMLSSCYYFNQVVDDIRDSNAMERGRKKDGGGAYENDKYKEGVYKAIDDIVKRPVNKKVQFEGIELIIPENTAINNDTWTLLDLKTGYGLPISFSTQGLCLNKTVKGKVYSLWYNKVMSGVNEIGKKIEKANDFIYTCK
jgi:putative liporotein